MDLVKSNDPIRAIKQAGLHSATRSFVPLTYSSPPARYGVEATAVCYAGNLHENRPPVLHCSCGFYAWKLSTPIQGSALPILDVELSGKVIECEYGYRAEYQRVLKLWIPDSWDAHWREFVISFATETGWFKDAPGGHPGSWERLRELDGHS